MIDFPSGLCLKAKMQLVFFHIKAVHALKLILMIISLQGEECRNTGNICLFLAAPVLLAADSLCPRSSSFCFGGTLDFPLLEFGEIIHLRGHFKRNWRDVSGPDGERDLDRWERFVVTLATPGNSVTFNAVNSVFPVFCTNSPKLNMQEWNPGKLMLWGGIGGLLRVTTATTQPHVSRIFGESL